MSIFATYTYLNKVNIFDDEFTNMTYTIHIATKKGAFQLQSENRDEWMLSDPILFGNIIDHMVADPRNPSRILISARTGHLGPTIYRSDDGGKIWKEAESPPKFPQEYDRTVKFTFWLTAGHSSQRSTWYAGTSPQGLFVSHDRGNTWQSVESFNSNPMIKSIVADNFGTPIGPLLHSINISPNNADHMILAMSLGGAFETKDGGETWKPFNKNVLADFLPDPYPEVGHCVHNMQMHPTNPHLIYQQGHCGVYRIDKSQDTEWTRIGSNMPDNIGDIGFPLILHPTDPDKLWIIPMDSTDIWPRTSIDGKPAVYHSKDAGQTWSRQDTGLPTQAWFTVLRQASAHDSADDLGIYFGNRQGQVWASFDEGSSWKCIVRNLPDIHSLSITSD